MSWGQCWRVGENNILGLIRPGLEFFGALGEGIKWGLLLFVYIFYFCEKEKMVDLCCSGKTS